jgi:type VI secretion system secreted protein VgrG
MWSRTFCLLILSFLTLPAYAGPILGSAGSFAVLGEAGVTNTGSSVIYGSVAGSIVTPAITGFYPPGIVVAPGVLYTAGVSTPFADANTAYDGLAGMAPTQSLTGQSLSGLTLTPGVYSFSTSASFTNTTPLYLNAQGNNNGLWVFQIGSSLTTATGSSVDIINPGPTPNYGIFWQVGSEATLFAGTAFEGNILADAAITLDSGATIGCGSALALGASVTLSDNTIDTGCNGGGTITTGGVIEPLPPSTVPEPGSMALLGSGLFALAGGVRRKLRK